MPKTLGDREKKLIIGVAVLTLLTGSAHADSDDRVWDFPDQSPTQTVAPPSPPQAPGLPQKRRPLKRDLQRAHVDDSFQRSAHQISRHQ
jgi:hypothetical protein